MEPPHSATNDVAAVINMDQDSSFRQRKRLGGKEWTCAELEAEWKRGDGVNFPPLPPGEDSPADYRARAAALNRLHLDFTSPDPFNPATREGPRGGPKRMFYLRLRDAIGLAYFLGFTVFGFFFFHLNTCPALWGSSEACPGLLWWTGLFFTLQNLAFFVAFRVYARYNRFSKLFPVTLREDAGRSKACLTCKEVVPLRSHHCSLCGHCIFNRDHHCILVAGCVGAANHRYFLGICLYSTLGAAVIGASLLAYLLSPAIGLPPLWPMGWLELVGPVAVFKWLFWGHISFANLALVLYWNVAALTFTFGFCGLIFQLGIVSRGMTTRDVMRGRSVSSSAHLDHLSVNARMRVVLGPWWLLQLLAPIPLLKSRFDKAALYDIYHAASKDL